MRIYSASSEETLRARKLLTDWAGAGFLSKEQYERLEQETVSDLRTTNIFLRVVFFLFTLMIVGAAAGLFLVFLTRPSQPTIGVFFLVFAAVCYAAAEAAVAQARLYRFGIEEALAVCSVGFLCAGVQLALFSAGDASSLPKSALVVPAAGALLSLWIWRRFGLWYAFPAAMIFVFFLPGYWTFSHATQHLTVVLFYAIGLICAVAARSGHRFDYLDDAYSLAEAFLWLGIYLAINLQLASFNEPARAAFEFPRSFYWTTWVLIWCLPPVVLARGLREKDRFVIAAGAIAAVLTLVSNKPYLGWPRHTWDPMLLGVLLTGVAFFVGRWLASGPDGVRRGFTARRLSGRDKQWMSAGSAALGLLSPSSLTPGPQTTGPEVRFGGGTSGGGGAGGNF